MSVVEGTPVYIELTDEQKIFEMITVDQQKYRTYDIDWCDDHLHYHAQMSGSGEDPFPYAITHRVDEHGENLHTYYWIASHSEVHYQDGADPTHCVRLNAGQLVLLFLSEEAILQEFLDLHEIPTLEEMNDLFVPHLVSYWERSGLVEEGQVIYCSICKKHYDYEANAPCEHVHWCEACGCFSLPPSFDGECPHRSEDGVHYVEPAEDEDEVPIL